MATVVSIKSAKQDDDRTSMETILVTPEVLNDWKLPKFQRPKRVNRRVRELAIQIRETEIIPGVITLGQLKNTTALYIVDGQHRLESFSESRLKEALADVRTMKFNTMTEMAKAFLELNSILVRMRPDDLLRGMADSSEILQKILKGCEFVGFDATSRRTTFSPILSMSSTLRAWLASKSEAPSSSVKTPTLDVLEQINDTEVEQLITFLNTAFAAWGRDEQNAKMWGQLNLTMCMWIFRRLVFGYNLDAKHRTVRLTINQFKQGLMALSASENYADWLIGRSLGDRDRSPCYSRIRDLFESRLKIEGKVFRMLLPSWHTSSAKSRK